MARTTTKSADAITNVAEPTADKPTKQSVEQQIAEVDELYVHNKISPSEYMQRKAKLTQPKQ